MTDISLREHLEQRLADLRVLLDERYATQTAAVDKAFEAADVAVQAALKSAEKAVAKAETAADKRFDAVNEFRGQLADQAALFLTRTEYAANHENLVDRVSELTARVDRTEGKSSGTTATIGLLLTVATVVIAIIVVFVNVLVAR